MRNRAATSRKNIGLQRLSELVCGGCGTIDHIEAEEGYRHRLMEMGFLAGTVICLDTIGPLGDPLVFRLRGYQVTLRRTDARAIWLKKTDGAANHALPIVS